MENIYSFNNSDKNNEGGQLMTSLMTVEVSSEGMEYLRKITDSGKNHELKRFFNSSEVIKDEIFAATFVLNELKKMKVFSYKQEKGKIILVRPVTIKITGFSKKAQRIIEKKKKVDTFPISFENFIIEGSKITFLMKFYPEENDPEKVGKRIPLRIFEGIEDYKVSSDTPIVSFEKWNSIINKTITKIKKRDYSESELLRIFFNTLKANKFTKMNGDDAVSFRKIYENANLYYPEFEKLSFDEKLTIFKKSFKGIEEEKRDSYSLAMNTFYTLAKNGLVSRVRAINPHSHKLHTLELKKIHFREGILRWVEYEDILYSSQKKISRGIDASNLWILLIDSSVQLISDKTSNGGGCTTIINR